MQEQTYIISSFKVNQFFLVKTEQKNERQLQNHPIKKPELGTQVFVIFLIYGITLSSILLAIFPKNIGSRRLIMTKKKPR